MGFFRVWIHLGTMQNLLYPQAGAKPFSNVKKYLPCFGWYEKKTCGPARPSLKESLCPVTVSINLDNAIFSNSGPIGSLLASHI